MKLFIRYFFKTVRLLLGPVVLFVDWITSPRGIKRDPAAQREIDAATSRMVLYRFKTCPFCIKVHRACKRLSLRIESRDAQHDIAARNELLQATGKVQVPCLKITAADGSVSWLQESNAIIKYLQGRFGSETVDASDEAIPHTK